MSLGNDRDEIIQAFETGWGTRTEWRIANDPTTDVPDKDEAWVRIDVIESAEDNNEWCSPDRWHVRRNGIILIAIFVPLRTSDVTIRGHADFAAAIFRGQVLDDTLYVHGVQSFHENESETWYGRNLVIDYTRDEQYSV